MVTFLLGDSDYKITKQNAIRMPNFIEVNDQIKRQLFRIVDVAHVEEHSPNKILVLVRGASEPIEVVVSYDRFISAMIGEILSDYSKEFTTRLKRQKLKFDGEFPRASSSTTLRLF